MIPTDILYKGWTYTGTGQIVGRTAFAPADLSFVGSATAVGDMTPDSSPGSDYEIFAIKSVDPDKAVAVKFLGVGKKTAEWVWLRYERKKQTTGGRATRRHGSRWPPRQATLGDLMASAVPSSVWMAPCARSASNSGVVRLAKSSRKSSGQKPSACILASSIFWVSDPDARFSWMSRRSFVISSLVNTVRPGTATSNGRGHVQEKRTGPT